MLHAPWYLAWHQPQPVVLLVWQFQKGHTFRCVSYCCYWTVALVQMLQFRTLEIGRRLTVKIETQRLPEDRFSNLAPFSSIGPTSDGRIKPDVVAPGVTVSAGKSSKPDECTRSVLHGTSMATPLVGGGAAIVRQYFLEGWYPTGTSNTQNSVCILSKCCQVLFFVYSAGAECMASRHGCVVQARQMRWTSLHLAAHWWKRSS